jgi:hypothetical protein
MVLAQALADGRLVNLNDQLAVGCDARRIEMFVEGNRQKRLDKLHRQMEFVSSVLPKLAKWEAAYIDQCPLAAYDVAGTDAWRFLKWLMRRIQLTPMQRDYVRCQGARVRVEMLVRRSRLAYLRFNEISSVSPSLVGLLDRQSDIRMYLNPIRVRARLETRALLDEEDAVPASLTFFPVDGTIRTVSLNRAARRLMAQLATAKSWCWSATGQLLPDVDLLQIEQQLLTLAKAGLVAFD